MARDAGIPAAVLEAARERVGEQVERCAHAFADREFVRPSWWTTFRWRLRSGNTWLQRERRRVPLRTRIYEGRPGEGKTLCLTADLIRAMRRGYVVAANYRVWDPETGQEALLVTSWSDVMTWAIVARLQERPMLIGLDEVHVWADSRQWQRTPGWWLADLAMHRHLGIGISGTTQSLSQVDSRLRLLVSELVRVRNRNIPLPLGRFIPWFIYEAVDAASVEGSDYRIEAASSYLMPWYAYAGYSTHEIVPSVSWDEDTEAAAERVALWELARDHINDFAPDYVGGALGGLCDAAGGAGADGAAL